MERGCVHGDEHWRSLQRPDRPLCAYTHVFAMDSPIAMSCDADVPPGAEVELKSRHLSIGPKEFDRRLKPLYGAFKGHNILWCRWLTPFDGLAQFV